MGGAVDRDLRRRPPTCCSSWRGGTRPSIVRTSTRLGPPQRGVEPLREGRRSRDPVASPPPAFSQLAAEAGATIHPGEIVVEGNLPDRSPVLVRTDRVNDILGSELTRDQMVGYLDADRVHVARRPRTATSRSTLPIVAARLHHRDRRDRGGRPAPRLRAARQDRARRRPTRVASPTTSWPSRDRPQRAGGERLRRGLARYPFLAPGELERSGVRTDAIVVANPLVSEESVLRTVAAARASLGDARLQRRAPQHRPGALRDRPLLRDRRGRLDRGRQHND